VIPYGSGVTANNNVWNALKVLDADPGNPANVRCIYSRHSLPKSSQDPGSGDGWIYWNREHSWPKAHGFPQSIAYDPYTGSYPYAMSTEIWPPYTDLHHMRVGVKMVNSHRGDLDFGTGSVLYADGRNPPFTVPESFRYSSLYWEPPDEVKGDIARTMFYMVVRYEGGDPKEPDLELVDGTTTTSSVPHTSGQLGSLAVLRAWHLADPVSDAERLRNNLIYSNYQGNRNPFIDYPEWVTNIWP
jgi:hypothetical protein